MARYPQSSVRVVLGLGVAITCWHCTVEIAPLDPGDASIAGSAGIAGSASAGTAGAAGVDSGPTDASDADVSDTRDEADIPDVGPERIDGRACGCGEPDCGDCPTVASVTVPGGGYSIDATETTVAEYLAWLDTAPPVSDQVSECASNDSFVPTCDWPPPLFGDSPRLPVRCVDWCDAVAYCAWAGKHLCGGTRGTLLTTEAAAVDPNASQWARACSGSDARRYAYGPLHENDRCNDSPLTPRIAPVGTFSQCEGGYPGIFDLHGNVAEWTNACPATATEQCLAQGGARGDIYADCAYVERRDRTRGDATVGIRCCKD